MTAFRKENASLLERLIHTDGSALQLLLRATLALLFGFLGRIQAAAVIVIMIGAVATVHAEFGPMMNWFGTQKGEGFQFHLLAIALATAVVVHGSGALSIDRAMVAEKKVVEREGDAGFLGV